jgi:hypothetical protein
MEHPARREPLFQEVTMIEEKIAILTKKDIHQAISNYIHNNLQISKEDIVRVMEKKVEQVLETKLKEYLDSNFFTKIVEMKVMAIIKEGTNTYYDRDSFEKFITSEVASKVRSMVFDRYKIEIKEKD